MFLNVIELAESFGVNESMVENWVRNEGLPCVPDRGRMLFDRGQVVTWAASRGLVAKAGFLASDSRSDAGLDLEELLRAGGIWRGVAAAGVQELFASVVGRLPGAVPTVRQLLQQRLRAARAISWAPVGKGLALPHLRSPVALGRDAGILALAFLEDALAMEEPAPDEIPVTRLLFFVAPSPRAHLEMLARLSVALTRGRLCGLMVGGATDEELFAALRSGSGGGGRVGS